VLYRILDPDFRELRKAEALLRKIYLFRSQGYTRNVSSASSGTSSARHLAQSGVLEAHLRSTAPQYSAETQLRAPCVFGLEWKNSPWLKRKLIKRH
jgi:hypothetical protein